MIRAWLLPLLLHEASATIADIRYLYNINQPSEWDEDLIRDQLSALNQYNIYPIESFKGDDLNLQIVLGNGRQVWIPKAYSEMEMIANNNFDSFIQSRRNSVAVFKNLKVPCEDRIQVKLKEFDVGFEDDYSEVISIDCSDLGARELNLKIGNNPTKGNYRLLLSVQEGFPSYDNPSIKVFSPSHITPNFISQDSLQTHSPKAIVLRSLINPFGQLNDINGEDELIISIYSDALDAMFKCEKFAVKRSSLITFNNL